MNWNKGFSTSYYATFVDVNTWKDTERFEIISGTIAKSDSNLIESADIETRNYGENTEKWIRVWLDAKQADSSEHVPLFTGLACSPSVSINGTIFSNRLECYSVLKPASDILLPRGWYAQQGVSGSHLVKKLLSVIPAPVVEIDNAPALTQSIIAEDGESNLTMAIKILNAINWRFMINGNGIVFITPKPTTVTAYYDSANNDGIEPTLEVQFDWYDCPNVFRAISDDMSAVARDDSPASKLSTVNRGREVWKEETSCDLSETETIGAYALRRLKEEQQKSTTISYSRRFNPDITIGDKVNLSYPAQGIIGAYTVMSQTIELTHGAKTAEEVGA